MKLTLLFVVLVCAFGGIQSLECGIDSTASQKDLKQIADNCMKKKVEVKKKPISEDAEDEEDLKESTTETSIKRSKRNDAEQKPSQVPQNNKQQNDELIPTDNNNNNTNSSSCIVQCIFGQLGMTDGNGFPVHHRLSDALLKTAKTRELRDFIQDTTDECFQLMEQGDHQDSCTYSVTLVNCLAERGKSNCADWPIGNLSFLTGKN